MCVCVCEKEKEKERESESEREREWEWGRLSTFIAAAVEEAQKFKMHFFFLTPRKLEQTLFDKKSQQRQVFQTTRLESQFEEIDGSAQKLFSAKIRQFLTRGQFISGNDMKLFGHYKHQTGVLFVTYDGIRVIWQFCGLTIPICLCIFDNTLIVDLQLGIFC